MIFAFLFVFFLSVSSVKNNQVDSPKSDSKEVNPAPDESTKLFHELKASRQREKKSTSCFVFSSSITEQG